MILKEILKEYDPVKVSKNWEPRFTCDGSEYDVNEAAEDIKEFCEKLMNIEAKKSEYIILALPYYDEGISRVSSYMFQKDELRDSLSDYSGLIFPNLEDNLTDEELEKYLDAVNAWMPESYGYDFMDWDEVLGSEVLYDNIERMGKDDFIADVLFEMSFNGMTEERQKERLEQLEEALRETERIFSLPLEERIAYYSEHNITDSDRQSVSEEEMRQIHLEYARGRQMQIQELLLIAGK